MSEWTPEATEYLEGYLQQVAALARSQGDEGDIIIEDLRAHITTEAEELGGAIVNLEDLRTILAGIGTPEQVAGGEAPRARPAADAPRSPAQPPPPPPPPPPRQPAPLRQTGPAITVQARPGSRSDRWVFVAVALALGVVAILFFAIIAAIAIPNLLRSRMSANESAAAGTVRTISVAQEEFQSRALADLNQDGIGDYGTLAELAEADMISAAMATGFKQGFRFRVEVTPGADGIEPAFTCTAVPETVGSTGIKHFYVDQTGVIRFEGDGSAADANSPPLSQRR